MTNKILFWIVGSLYFLSAFWGYKNEAEITLLVVATICTPLYVRHKLNSFNQSKNEPIAEAANENESKKLGKLKFRFIVLIAGYELLFVSMLLYKVTADDMYALFTGLGFLVVFIYISICRLSLCPRCNQHFYREKENKPFVQIGPGSIGVHYYPIQVAITNKCTSCGLSWRA